MSLSQRPQNQNFGSFVRHRNTLAHQARVDAYMTAPTRCTHCSEALPYDKRRNQFCSKSCARKEHSPKQTRTPEQREKIKNALEGRKLDDSRREAIARGLARYHETKIKALTAPKPKVIPELKEIDVARRFRNMRFQQMPWPVTVLRKCCRCTRFLPAPRQICNQCSITIRTYRSRAKFTFNIYAFPEVFPLQLIEEHGWYSPGGRGGKNKGRNMNGVSRDHLLTIADGFASGIEPELLAHPANCELVMHSENMRKRATSSITFEELLTRIDEWTAKYGGQGWI